MTPQMSQMNQRLEDILLQLRHMELSLAELKAILVKYDPPKTAAHVLLIAAVQMLLLETEFAK